MDQYNHLDKVIVTSPNVRWWETFILGKCEATGHWNNISGALRGLAAFWQTVIAIAVLFVISWYLSKCHFFAFTNLGDEAAIGLLALASGIFGATFYNERSSIHSKWQYLSNLFNQAIENEHKEIRDHMFSCLAHDILVMEMWGHKTFRMTFKEALKNAIELLLPPEKATSELQSIAEIGIPYSRALELIEEYTEICAENVERKLKKT